MLSFHISIKTQSEYIVQILVRGNFQKTMSWFDYQDLQITHVIEFCFIIWIHIPCDDLPSRNAAHYNNRGKTNYSCLHLQFKIGVKYICLSRLVSITDWFWLLLLLLLSLKVFFILLSWRKITSIKTKVTSIKPKCRCL